MRSKRKRRNSRLSTSVCNPGTTSQSRDFGIGILQSRDPGINLGIENPVKPPMATDQAERQRRSYRFHRPLVE